MEYDVFISYRHTEKERVTAFRDDLLAAGVRVWMDESIQELESIQEGIEGALAASRMFLAWYSAGYPESRPCQWELTRALVAALQAGEVVDRIVVVNPEARTGHIYPELLRDQKLLAADAGARDAAVAAVRARAQRLSGTFATLASRREPARTQWYGRRGTSASYFAGRLPEIWQVHSALHADQYPVIHARTPVPLAVLVGMGGIGKSLLAEEYALRFQRLYPGGVFWLNARASVQDQLAGMAGALGLQPAELAEQTRNILAGALRTAAQPYLWVVDELAEGENADLDEWLPPESAYARTLVTTRSRRDEGRGTHIPLYEMSGAEALALLTRRVQPPDDAERRFAEQICAELAYHPLALDVAGRALASLPRRPLFQTYHARLADPRRHELEFAASLRGELPNGHEKSIAATLAGSLEALSDAARTLLRLACVLAQAPIPAPLAVDALAELWQVDAQYAEDRVHVGLDELDDVALARVRPDEGRYEVHALVRRAVRFLERDAPGDARLSLATAAFFTRTLIPPASWGWNELPHDRLDHAEALYFALAAAPVEQGETHARAEVALLRCLAGFARVFNTRRLPEMRAALAATLEKARRWFAPDGDTLFALNEYGVFLWGAVMSPGEAEPLFREALELSLVLNGGRHIDTHVLLGNWRDCNPEPGTFRALAARVLPAPTGARTLTFNPT